MLQRRFIAFCTGLLFFLATHAQINMQTGSATFSLPMFDWKDDKSRLSTIVALSYNSGSGLKVSDVASNVGQGWNLLAGGVVSRMPLGEPDDQKGDGQETEYDLKKYPDGILYSYMSNLPDKGCPTGLTRYPIYGSKNQKYKQHNGVAVDKQLDYFSFQFNGKSGMFVLNPGLGGGCKMLGDSKMKINFVKDENLLNQNIRTTITAFTIQDEDGMIYRFQKHGLTKVLESKYCDKYMTQQQDQPNFKSQGVYYQTGFENSQYVRPWIIENWYLDEIEDPLTHRKIIFHYDNDGPPKTLKIMAGAELSYDSWHNYVVVTYKKSIEQVKTLTSVDCPDGHKIIFKYNKDRVDLPNDKVLTSVDVTYTAPNKINLPETRILSRHVLNTSYFILNRYGTPSTPLEKQMARLCLRSVKKIGPDLKEDAQPYTFDYYMGGNASDDFVPPPFSVSHDIWGYYNGNESAGYNPGETISPLFGYSVLDFQRLRGLCYLRDGVSGSILNPKDNYAKNGLLKQIIYPTGGALSYDYAQNTGVFIGASTASKVGGVHVSITKSTDGGYSNDCSHPLTTQYYYVLDGAGAPGDPGRASSLWGIERPDNVGEMTMNYAPEKRNYRWNPLKCHGGIFGCCYWAYQYPGIQSQPQALGLTGFQKFMVNAEPVLGALSAVMTVVDIIIVATSTAGGPPGAIIALVIDVIASYVIVALSCTSDNSKHGTSISYYSFDMNGVSPLPMQFKRVETVEGSGDIGRTVYEFTNTDDHAIWENNNPNLSGKQRFAPWAYGLPKKVTVYDKSNKKVKETENKYYYFYVKRPLLTEVITFTNTFPPLPVPTIQPLASCKCNVKTVSSQRSDDWKKLENINANQTTSDAAMGVDIYPLYTGRTLLIGSVDRAYKKGDDAQWVETETGYYYDSEFEQFQTVTKKSSDGVMTAKATICSKRYSGGIIDVMKQNNILNVPIKIVEHTDDGYFHETVHEYTQLANGDIKLYRTLEERSVRPTSMQDWTHYSGPTSTDYSRYKVIKLLSYDANGNLISVKDEGGRSVASIYDYNDKYIVATVANADAVTDKPVYTSFETATRGGWQLAASSSYDPNAVTGKWSLNLAGNSCTAPINNTSKAYILSFWANNSNVALTSGATLVKSAPVVNGFTYYEYNIAAGTTSITVSGNALIDELRLYPATARMNTTTYDPLIGKTSECDENNRLTYYEYDDLARLRFIKDENRNIVKMYEYNNVARPNGCPATYYNPLITQYYTKSNCGPDYIGSDFPYTIPANKYSSTISQEDADAQAEMELMDKGQANADAMANNSSNCKLIYFNAGKTENFVSESCDEGYEGGTVPYTVPARTYSSIVPGEVEQMELDDIAANGQAYANDPAHRICTLDINPVWELVEGRTECRTVNSEGHLFAEYKDINPNSPSYNSFEWKDTGPNSTCPSGPWNSDDMSGDYRSNCPAGWYGYNVYISMPAGAFVSYVSKEDANNQASAEAQRRADQRYYCEGPAVYVEADLDVWWPDNPDVEVFFQNAYTGEIYSFYGNATGMIGGGIPEGAYDAYFNVFGPHSNDYDLYVCGFVAHGTGGYISRNQLYISENGCHAFHVYPHQNH